MKGTPVELIKGNTLKNQIYNSLSHHKLASTTRLLRHTLKTQLKLNQYDSELTQMKTEMCSPAPKTEHSLQKMSKSVNQSWTSRKGKNKSGAKSKDKIGKEPKKQKEKECKGKSRSQILVKSKYTTVDKGKSGHSKMSSRDKTKTKSTVKQCKKINLESIIQQSSSDQQLITPDHKNKKNNGHNNNDKIQKSLNSLSNSRTKKKEKNELFSESTKRKIQKSFKQPQTFQKILRVPEMTISYRIIKRRLIEIEIYTLKPAKSLKVSLSKGNLQCQNIQQNYNHVSANTILALFSSVRSIELDTLVDFPRIDLLGQFQEETVERSVLLPYTWLHYCDDHPSSMKKSKIKTKMCLCDIPISSTNLHILSDIFRTWLKKSYKGHSQFQASFALCEQDYSLKLIEEAHQKFTLELEGKGEARLLGMIEFLQRLIS